MKKAAVIEIPKKPETELFQAHIDKGLLKQVREKRERDNVSWRDLCETLLKFYLTQDLK